MCKRLHRPEVAVLDLRHIRLLVTLSEHGSLRAAARASHYSPAAFHRALRSLELQTGCVLYEGGPAGTTLTRSGAYLVARGRQLLGEFEQMRRQALAYGRDPAA
jgi:LysR family transcriptional regulator of abg operon